MSRLAVVCPSRGRPQQCRRMIDSALETSQADVLIYTDRDDPWASQYTVASPREVLWCGDPIGRGAAVNLLCQQYQYDYYLVVSDDITFDRTGWYSQIISKFSEWPDDLGCVHLLGENGASYVNWACVSKRWIEILGWFNYPGCRWFCQDTIIQCLAGAIGRLHQIPEQALTHHVEHTPDVMDRLRHDQDAFLWYMAQFYLQDLEKLRRAMQT